MTLLEILKIVIGPTFLIFLIWAKLADIFNSIVKTVAEKHAPPPWVIDDFLQAIKEKRGIILRKKPIKLSIINWNSFLLKRNQVNHMKNTLKHLLTDDGKNPKQL